MSASTSCSCCGEGPLVEIESRTLDKHSQETKLSQCKNCLVVHNYSAYTNVLAYAEQMDKEQTVIRGTNPDACVADETHLSLLQNSLLVFAKLPDDNTRWSDAIFLDFGCGNGKYALAATKIFRKSIGVDSSLGALRTRYSSVTDIASMMPPSVEFHTNLDTIEPGSVDVLLSWHTFEHLADTRSVWRALVPKLKMGAKVIVQVPLYRQRHLERVHFALHNGYSLRTMFESVGVRTVSVNYDTTNSFVTYFGNL